MKAFKTAMYLINCLPSLTLKHDTPYFKLYKQHLSYDFFHTFETMEILSSQRKHIHVFL